MRYDTLSCRLFVYFDLNINKSKVKYYEVRNILGNLLETKKEINKCFQEINKT